MDSLRCPAVGPAKADGVRPDEVDQSHDRYGGAGPGAAESASTSSVRPRVSRSPGQTGGGVAEEGDRSHRAHLPHQGQHVVVDGTRGLRPGSHRHGGRRSERAGEPVRDLGAPLLVREDTGHGVAQEGLVLERRLSKRTGWESRLLLDAANDGRVPPPQYPVQIQEDDPGSVLGRALPVDTPVCVVTGCPRAAPGPSLVARGCAAGPRSR
jgi:hypothetical protein